MYCNTIIYDLKEEGIECPVLSVGNVLVKLGILVPLISELMTLCFVT